MKLRLLVVLSGLGLFSSGFAAQDIEKSKDYPALKRWPHSHIESYSDKDFDAFEFETPDTSTRVEGRTIHLSYNYDEGTEEPSELKLLRNYQNALEKAGWTVLTKPDAHLVVAKLTKEGKEVWVQVRPGSGGYYFDIVEKGEMKQEVTANDMLDELNASGHVALHINFDSGKATIKEDSKPIIGEMVKLLKDTGDIAECGVWRGGSMMVVALTLLAHGDRGRSLYLFDTFEGMSSPTDKDKSFDGVHADAQLERDPHGSGIWCYASLEDVRANILSTGYPKEKIHLIKGKVEDTIPQSKPPNLSLLRLDTDWYESTKHELEHLFPRLHNKGILIIDDYGHWQGAKKAVDEYFSEHVGNVYLHRIDYTGRILVRTGTEPCDGANCAAQAAK